MSITTYSELETAVGNWLTRDDLTSYIPDLITVGEKRIFDELRAREMKSALSSAIASGTITVPSDFLAFAHVYVDGSPTSPLTVTSLEALFKQFPTRSSEGLPFLIAENGTTFEFGPYPDSTYTIKGTYYAQPLALSGSQTTNAIFPVYADLYLWAALAEAEPFLKNDSRVALWEGKYQQTLARINKRHKQAAFAGSVIQPRAA